MPYIAAELTVDPASIEWPQPAAPADGTCDLVQPPAAAPGRGAPSPRPPRHGTWIRRNGQGYVLETLCNGRDGAERSIGDPHETSGDALPVERRRFWRVVSKVDLYGCHQAVKVSRQGWPGHLDR